MLPFAAAKRHSIGGPDIIGAPENSTIPPVPRAARARRFQWTIARKIGGLAAVLILFILLLLGYSIYTLRGIQGELGAIAKLDVPLTELTNKIEIEQLEQQITMDQLLRLARLPAMEGRPQELQSAKQRLEAHSDQLKRNINLGIRLSEHGSTVGFKPLFDSVTRALHGLRRDAEHLHTELFAMARVIESGGQPDNQTVDTVLARGAGLDKKMLALIGKIEQFTTREINILENHERIFLVVNTALGTVGVLLGIILSALVIAGIRGNLFRLTRHVSEITQAIAENREISAATVSVNSSDEFSNLAENLSQMISGVSTDMQKRDELSRHLQKVATTDPLTGAFNRLKWEENLAWEIERIKRSRDELSMIIFDIDHFKMVNDTHGHDAGDTVLKEIVGVVSGAIRQSDTLYRIGGEEFVILAPHTHRDQAAVLAEKVRAAIESRSFEIIGQVTVSMGCAQLDKQGDDGTRMAKRADVAMYQAKESGRNRVCIEEAA